MSRLTVFQHAYVVDDIEAAAIEFSRTLYAGPFYVTQHHHAPEFTYRGTTTQADVSYAFGYSGQQQIQLIQQHDDLPSIYRDMYPRGGTGFHHVAMLVRDYSGERQRLLDEGFELACELHVNDVDACYFDTRAATGGFTELHSWSERIVFTFARWRAANEAWDGTGPATRHHVSGT
jgi:Glyoxalase/Bleomycin resistance protein/Dioxygenase superfamily